MARTVFVFACLLLVGIWIHPYMSGAFETHAPQAVSAAAEASMTSARLAGSESPFVTLRGHEGFWRLGKSEDGVYWFVTPDGRREFLNTVTTVQPFQVARDAQGVSFVSRDWDGTLGKYDGDLDAWARKTAARVQDVGFKGLGAWCHPVLQGQNLPLTRDLNLWRHYSAADFRLYHPEFVKTMDTVVEKAVAELKDNRNLVGYFTDNELDWSDATIGPRHYFDGLPAGDPNRVQVIDTIKSLWPKLDDYNAAWNVSLKDWRELDTQPTLDRRQEPAYSALFSAWLEKAAGDYFRITTASLRKFDPHHLILGVRFAGNAPREVVRASRDYTDAQSLNYYVPDARLDPDLFSMMHHESGQPIVLSEYGFHALDNRSGARNTCGFQAQVPDQQARAEAYQLFTSRLARVPYVVGADWFQWSDEPPSGRGADGEDVNFGVVDVDDKLYEQLADAIRQTTPRLNPLHAASAADASGDVFRSDYARRPTANIVKLERPINVNGELSDWNEAFRIGGMQCTDTVGIARSDVRLPNVYMGWNEEGLYLAAEVFTSHIETTAATGRWWTRDHLELWFSTRPVGTSQQAYNPFNHQFFFVPEVSPIDGRLGTIGQWHRPGDAIADNVVPSPLVRQSTRLLPARYVVEMFFPAAVLNGWRPTDHPELAFNFYARDFGASADYFWSAPKETQTNVRPGTWGRLILSGPQMALGQ